MNSTEEPPLPKNKVSTGCALAIIAMVYGGAALLGLLVYYDYRSNDIHPKSDMKGMEIAIKGYKTEYLDLPHANPDVPREDNPPFETNDANGRALIDILLAKNVSRNPREIRFWEGPPRKSSGAGYSPDSGLVDSWGRHGYKVILDYDNDGKITDPQDAEMTITSDVILYSAGADRDFSTWMDNVCSWK